MRTVVTMYTSKTNEKVFDLLTMCYFLIADLSMPRFGAHGMFGCGRKNTLHFRRHGMLVGNSFLLESVRVNSYVR